VTPEQEDFLEIYEGDNLAEIVDIFCQKWNLDENVKSMLELEMMRQLGESGISSVIDEEEIQNSHNKNFTKNRASKQKKYGQRSKKNKRRNDHLDEEIANPVASYSKIMAKRNYKLRNANRSKSKKKNYYMSSAQKAQHEYRKLKSKDKFNLSFKERMKLRELESQLSQSGHNENDKNSQNLNRTISSQMDKDNPFAYLIE
jgi:hypothetical protein